MNREFHGTQWEYENNGAYLTYQQYRVVIGVFNADFAAWSIWDKSNIDMFNNDGKLVAYGSAANMARACFQCETWIDSQAGKQ